MIQLFFHEIVSTPACLTDSLRRRACARNVSFRISLRWLIHIINSVDKTKLSYDFNLTITFQFLQFGDFFGTSKFRLTSGLGFSFRPSITCVFTINLAKRSLGEVKIETMRAEVFIMTLYSLVLAFAKPLC